MDICNTILCELVQTRRTEFPCPLLLITPKSESSNINIKPVVNTYSRKEKKHTMCREERGNSRGGERDWNVTGAVKKETGEQTGVFNKNAWGQAERRRRDK